MDRTRPTLATDRLILRMLDPSEAPRAVEYYTRNLDHLLPWDPPRSEFFLTRGHWEERLLLSLREFEQDRALRLFMLHRDDPSAPLAGCCNFTGFTRGPFQACRLGYSLAADAVGHGLMTEALRAALTFVFQTLRFHRVEANYMPTNVRSGRVLRRLGFEIQGFARDYIYIDGDWQDHVLTALTNPDPEPPPPG